MCYIESESDTGEATRPSTNVDALVRRALRLAEKGRGKVSPNPLVGAVIVKHRRIVGEGYHREFGGPHAEIYALEAAGDRARGATMIVTLEPCCHLGKTPPCVDAIVKAGIRKVIVGCVDPNPIVSGKGIEQLRAAGVTVEMGPLREACEELNEGYFSLIRRGRPLATVKFAQTLDGRIADLTGQSKWITGEKARAIAHRLRAQHDAVMVGVRTVLVDDPFLTVRLAKGPNPKRIILDSRLRTPPDAKVLAACDIDKTILATTERSSYQKRQEIEQRGAKVWVVNSDAQGRVDLHALWKRMAEEGITSVLVEGGNTLCSAVVRAGLADKVAAFIAPKLLGVGLPALSDLGIGSMADALVLKDVRVQRVGQDVLVMGYIAEKQNSSSAGKLREVVA